MITIVPHDHLNTACMTLDKYDDVISPAIIEYNLVMVILNQTGCWVNAPAHSM